MKHAVLAVSFAALALASAPALAEDASYFDGFYAGILGGVTGNAYKNLLPTGGPARGQVAAVAGWTTNINPEIIAGGEVLGAVATDFAGNYSYSGLALGHVGRMVDDTVAFYLVGGGGWYGAAPVVAWGARAEMAIWDDFAVRWEMLNFVQVAASSGGYRSGVTGQMYNVGIVWHDNPDEAQRVALERVAPDFDGLYTGVQVGVHLNAAANFFPDVGFGGHIGRGEISAVLGWNFKLNDLFVVGVEGQGGYLFDSSGDEGFAAFGMVRAGVTPFEGLMAYATGGVGVVQGKAAYAVGGGIEHGSFANSRLRAELIGYGELGQSLTSYRVSGALLWDIN